MIIFIFTVLIAGIFWFLSETKDSFKELKESMDLLDYKISNLDAEIKEIKGNDGYFKEAIEKLEVDIFSIKNIAGQINKSLILQKINRETFQTKVSDNILKVMENTEKKSKKKATKKEKTISDKEIPTMVEDFVEEAKPVKEKKSKTKKSTKEKKTSSKKSKKNKD